MHLNYQSLFALISYVRLCTVLGGSSTCAWRIPTFSFLHWLVFFFAINFEYLIVACILYLPEELNTFFEGARLHIQMCQNVLCFGIYRIQVISALPLHFHKFFIVVNSSLDDWFHIWRKSILKNRSIFVPILRFPSVKSERHRTAKDDSVLLRGRVRHYACVWPAQWSSVRFSYAQIRQVRWNVFRIYCTCTFVSRQTYYFSFHALSTLSIHNMDIPEVCYHHGGIVIRVFKSPA